MHHWKEDICSKAFIYPYVRKKIKKKFSKSNVSGKMRKLVQNSPANPMPSWIGFFCLFSIKNSAAVVPHAFSSGLYLWLQGHPNVACKLNFNSKSRRGKKNPEIFLGGESRQNGWKKLNVLLSILGCLQV